MEDEQKRLQDEHEGSRSSMIGWKTWNRLQDERQRLLDEQDRLQDEQDRLQDEQDRLQDVKVSPHNELGRLQDQ